MRCTLITWLPAKGALALACGNQAGNTVKLAAATPRSKKRRRFNAGEDLDMACFL
jgi:hypothetical protein